MANDILTRQPRGLLRASFRLPLWLYRLHLGWLLGDRFLLLTHFGRKTGQPHQTVVEVVHHDKITDACVVASGWGERSDWFRNIRKTPHVIFTLGNRKWAANAVILSASEAESALLVYAHEHALAFRELATLITGRDLVSPEEASSQLARQIPLVALRPDPPIRKGREATPLIERAQISRTEPS